MDHTADVIDHPIETCVSALALMTPALASDRTALVRRVRARLAAMDDDCVRVLERACRGPQGGWELPGHGEPDHGLVLSTFIADVTLDRCWLSVRSAEQLGDRTGTGSTELRIGDLRGRIPLTDRRGWMDMMQHCDDDGGVHDHHHLLRTYGQGPRPAWTTVGRAPASPRTGARLIVGVLATAAPA